MLKVLHVVTMTERAGLETMIMNYYRNIDRSQVQFDFLKHRYERHAYDAEIEKLGGRIYSIPSFNPLNTNGYLTQLNIFFKEHHDYDVVHVHLDCLSSIPLFFAKKYGIKVRIAHSHVSKMTFDIKYPLRIFFRTLIPFYATHLFACSEDAGKWMYGKKKFEIITNAIDCNLFSFDKGIAEELRKQYHIDDKFVIGHVGRFDSVKNHKFLISIFSEILKMKENSILLLVGTGEEVKVIKSLVCDLNINDKVLFVGSVSNVSDMLHMMNVFVFPSLYEGLGISLIEAQAVGLKCYASTAVPTSANITGNVTYLSLDLSDKEWADRILVDDVVNSCNVKEKIAESGYDIKIEAQKLLAKYSLYSKGGL